MSSPTVTLPGSVEMPLLGFGTWQLRGSDAYRAVRTALEVGYRHLDTATMYGNEEHVGRALRDSGVAREEVFLTTKLPPDRVGRERATLDASLRALDVAAVDLWLIHWPPSAGGSLPMWRELVTAHRQGRARAIGVSNYSVAEIDELTGASGVTPAVNQIRWGPSLFDSATLAQHRERGVTLEGYSPFKTTDLSDPVLSSIARSHGVQPAQVVLRWHLQHEVVVIPKSATPERIAGNARLDFVLSADEMAVIDALGKG